MVSSESSYNKTTKLVEELLLEIRETQSDFASVRTELSILHDNVRGLSRIIREGDGDMSILTKMAILDQKIDELLKWRDVHYNTHRRITKEIENVAESTENIEFKILLIENEMKKHEERIKEEEAAAKKAIEKQIALAHEQELSNTKTKGERQRLMLKIVGAIAMALVTFAAGYFANF